MVQDCKSPSDGNEQNEAEFCLQEFSAKTIESQINSPISCPKMWECRDFSEENRRLEDFKCSTNISWSYQFRSHFKPNFKRVSCSCHKTFIMFKISIPLHWIQCREILVPGTIHIGGQWIAKWISRKSGAKSCTVWSWEGDLPIIHAAVKVCISNSNLPLVNHSQIR